MMTIELPARLDYPIVAIGDLHGQRVELERLVAALGRRPNWPTCAVVFLGDFVDRNPEVRETIDLVIDLLDRPPGGSAVMGNHDRALVRSARLDGGPPSAYWSGRYRSHYDHVETFASDLGRRPGGAAWDAELVALRDALPAAHREFLASLPWLVEAPGHLFLHRGLSPDLAAGPAEQVEALHARRELWPIPDTPTDRFWEDEYPAWLGADRGLSASPLPHPGKVQVTGHERVPVPDVNATRIRLDTSGGLGRPTACLLRSAEAGPIFVGGT